MPLAEVVVGGGCVWEGHSGREYRQARFLRSQQHLECHYQLTDLNVFGGFYFIAIFRTIEAHLSHLYLVGASCGWLCSQVTLHVLVCCASLLSGCDKMSAGSSCTFLSWTWKKPPFQ